MYIILIRFIKFYFVLYQDQHSSCNASRVCLEVHMLLVICIGKAKGHSSVIVLLDQQEVAKF